MDDTLTKSEREALKAIYRLTRNGSEAHTGALADEQLVILGQVAKGFGVDDLSVGAQVELVVEPLYEVDGVEHLIYRWKPVAAEVSR